MNLSPVLPVALCGIFSMSAMADDGKLEALAREKAMKDPYISECVERVPAGSVVRRKPVYQFESDYLSMDNGVPHIKAEMDLRYSYAYMPQEEMDQAIKIMEGSRQKITAFYAQHGIKLDLTFNHQTKPNPVSPKDHFVVSIRRNMGSLMRETFWGVNAGWDADSRGQIHTHEFSHHLGLKDEYKTRLSERVGEADNIMNNWDAPNARFYPHQIRQLLKPLCG